MTEKMPGLTPKQEGNKGEKDERAKKSRELYDRDYLDPQIQPEDRRDAEPDIVEFEGMIAEFENRHSLSALSSIEDLTAAEAPFHPEREPANQALVPIVATLNTLKERTNISPAMHELLRMRYSRVSRAVGIINKDNKVDHERWGPVISSQL